MTAAFVAPFLMPASQEFALTAARVPGVRLAIISHDPADRFMPELADAVVGHWQVEDPFDPAQLVEAVRGLEEQIGPVERIIGVLEQLQVPVAQARDELGLPGVDAQTATNFRDKAQMKDVLHAAGIPCARHAMVRSSQEAEEFIDQVGLPVVAKPPDGAGTQDTHRLETQDDLASWLEDHTDNLDQGWLLEEFLTGKEHTYEAVTLGGETIWASISDYGPAPLEVLENPWVQWTVLLRRSMDDDPAYAQIQELAPRALTALGLQDGFSHMEWFERPDGSVAISEVGARPPGKQLADMTGLSHGFDFTRMWSELVLLDRFEPAERTHASGTAYLRGLGEGKVMAVHGLEEIQRELGDIVVDARIPEPGQDANASYEGEGWVVVRHEDTEVVRDALERIISTLRVELVEVEEDGDDQGDDQGGEDRGEPELGAEAVTDPDARTVVMLSPGFPLEQACFTRALARAGARVVGVGDQGIGDLPEEARVSLAHYEQVDWADEDAVVERLAGLAEHARIDQVESTWEPLVILAARIRERLGLPGLTVEQVMPFRDKERMKQVLDEAGIRTPRHAEATSEDGIRSAAEQIGYPLIVKPVDGAGSADTHRVDSAEQLEEVIPQVAHVGALSVEEFVDGEEYTYDTVCAGGQVVFENIAWYRPRPLVARTEEWISPMTIALRDIGREDLQDGREMGRRVLEVLGFDSGFTHMEWYRKDDGEVVFGEIGARPPGARLVDVMNFCADDDLFRTWAEAVVDGTTEGPGHEYNAVSLFTRAEGEGVITRIEGLEEVQERYADHLCLVDLLEVGEHRRDWKATLLSDGIVIVRHRDLDELVRITDDIARELRLYAEPEQGTEQPA